MQNNNKDIKGKFRKTLNKKCPDCEIGNLQIRELSESSIVICPNCGYEEEDKAQNKNNIRKLREIKNEKVEVR
jgi:Zn ribbon nucleic-acid-binding protein